MYTTIDDQLNELLRTSVESLDISPEEYRLAVSRYEAVGASLAAYWNDSEISGEVYPQGSMRLGTVTRNIHRNDEIDIDLVALRNLSKSSTSQLQLKADTGHGLDLFVKGGPEGSPWKDEGKRCWTLHYPGFHVDTLPALPDEDGSPTGIVITDTEVRQWQSSDPIGYANWFHDVMRTEIEERRSVLSKSMDVDSVPDWAIKTTLQHAVQALKRHRDIFFAQDLSDRPASVILTTLAARAYRGGDSLYSVLLDVTARMPALVECVNGTLVVSNPIQPNENFADRWRHDPRRAERFFAWIDAAQTDFAGIGSERGIDSVLTKIERSFGYKVAKQAESAMGHGFRGARQVGELGIAAGSGVLLVGGGRKVRPHEFHGDPTPTA